MEHLSRKKLSEISQMQEMEHLEERQGKNFPLKPFLTMLHLDGLCGAFLPHHCRSCHRHHGPPVKEEVD